MSPVWSRPRAAAPQWAAFGASPRVLRWIRRGVRPRLTRRVEPFNLGELLITDAAQLAAWHELRDEYLRKGAIRKVSVLTHCSPVFLVPKKNGTFRLVIDLRHFNQHGPESTVQYDDLRTIAEDVEKGDWLAAFDLQDGYMHLQIEESSQHYFGFRVNGENFICTSLPFGWRDAPRVFQQFACEVKRLATKARLPKQAMRHGGRRWFKSPRPPPRFSMRAYLDDFLLVARTKARMVAAVRHTQKVLKLLGVQWHPIKSQWKPTQKLQHLGLEIDAKAGELQVPAARLTELKGFAKFLQQEAGRKKRWLPARLVARFAGKAISAMLAIQPARFFLRSLFKDLKTKAGWGSAVKLSHQTLRDLGWWRNLPTRWNGKAFLTQRPTVLLTVDASKTAWAGILRKPGLAQPLTARAHWAAAQRGLPISVLELYGLYFSVKTFLSHLHNAIVRVRTDNTSVLHDTLNLYARSDAMFGVLRQLFYLIDVHNIHIIPEYVHTSLNEADAPSRFQDVDEWKLHPRAWREIEQRYGPHTIDRFASVTSAQLPLYNSFYHDPLSSGVDAFAQPAACWQQHNNFCNPPWRALPKLLAFLRSMPGARATVVAPYWPTEAWCEDLLSLCTSFYLIPRGRKLFASALTGCASYTMRTRWPVLVCRIGDT